MLKKTWVLKSVGKQCLRKNICRIYGVVYENDNWRLGSNLEVEKLIGNEQGPDFDDLKIL